MKYFGDGLSELHKDLNAIIRKREHVEKAKELFLELHSFLHSSSISNGEKNEYDELISDLKDSEYAIMPTSKDETIAWALWHMARIEDLTMNILVARKDQIFNDEWKVLLQATIQDTGNALTDEQIIELSKNLNKDQLLEYRSIVGKRTREIISELSAEDMKRKISEEDLVKILEEGGVTPQNESIWLLDFWGHKDVAGILLMPPSRHMMLHINDCCKWKEHIRSKNKYYLQ